MTAHRGLHPTGVAPVRTLSVVVVAETRARARALRGLLTGPGFAVVAEATSALGAEAAVVEHTPGAVLIDLDPSAGGIEAIERIMGTCATPVVVCGRLVAHSQAALAAGAVDVIGALDAPPDSPQYAVAVRRHLRVAARVRVITHPRSRLRARGIGQSGPYLGATVQAPGRLNGWRRATARGVRLVVIGASTGGPPALATILADLPADFPLPVLVVQHMADGFVEGLASWLDGISSLPVVMAEDGQRLVPGTVHVAPAGSNTLVRPGLRLELCPPLAGQFHVPCVDATFASAASTYGLETVGVLLTGMGRDGAEGLRALHERGATTIGQDEPTSVVWGMPGAAMALGAVELELPLPAIGPAIVQALRERGISCADAAVRR